MSSVGKNEIDPARSSLTGAHPVDAIAGIGSRRRRWLASAFSVHTIAELARLEVAQLVRGLSEAGDLSGAGAAAAWIATARRVVSEGDPIDAEVSAAEPGPEWEPFAAFVVEFQRRDIDGDVEAITTAHHVEADLTRTWTGIAAESAVAWMVEQADEALRGPDRSAGD